MNTQHRSSDTLNEDDEQISPNQINVNLQNLAPSQRDSEIISVKELARKKPMEIEDETEIPPCRVCLSNQMTDKDNPLINPCDCKGSIGLLHVLCLKQWVNTVKKVKQHNDCSTEYNWKIIQCEMCKMVYPHTVFFKEHWVNILDYDIPADDPYVVIESYPKEGSRHPTSKSIYVVNMQNDKKTIKLGRGHEADLRIADISVSRLHSVLHFEGNKGEFRMNLEDKSSKFGSLVLSKSPHFIDSSSNSESTFQIGRSLFQLSHKGKKQTFSCCLKPKQNNKNSKTNQRLDTNEQ